MMERQEVFAKVSQLLTDYLRLAPGEVAEGSHVVNDLGADSLAIVELGFKFMETFGIGMLTAGLVMGQSTQREAEALMLPAQLDELDTLDRKGATANAIAYAGGAVAGVGIIVGATLIAVGVERRKASPDSSAALPSWRSAGATLLVDGWFDRDGGGLVLRGRF